MRPATSPRVLANRRRLLLASLTLAATVALALLVSASGRGAPQPAGTGPLPLLGTADPLTNMIGSAPAGEPGETWAYRQLPLAVGSAEVGTRPVRFGPQPDPANLRSQLAFLRYTDGNGWQVFDTPVDAAGNPYRGPIPNALSARITRRGGGVLVGRDTAKPVAEQVVVLGHDPGGPWRVPPAPPPTVLLPAEGERPAEALAADLGAGRVADAAFDEASGRTGLFFAPVGRSIVDGVLHFDGTDWTREPVKIPAGSETAFRIVAIDATGLGNAWAIAEANPALGRSFVLLERGAGPGGPEWVERGLGAARFADRETPALGISGLAPLDGAAQPLTVTSDGVWVDLHGTIAGAERDATIFFSIASGAVTGSWCDAEAVCARPLGVKLSRQVGYRSFAWPGPGFGGRIVTNPLDPGGGEETNGGTYLRLEGEEFERLPGGGGNFRAGGAFASDDNGWLDGPVQISAAVQPDLLRQWPLPLRAPLTAATTAPGAARGALGSPALAVGVDGGVARYTPGKGWQREFLLSSSGAVRKPVLRGVAWPERGRAHAVGDLGAMWMWNASDGLWISDPGLPIGFEGNLTGVAFDPANPDRGFAVGKDGVLLRYGKSWDQDPLPPGLAGRSFTSIAFAAGEAMVAAGDEILVEDGGGWHVAAAASQLLHSIPGANQFVFAVAGLPDGGAVAAGRDVVIERDGGPGSPWRFSKQPLPGSTAIAAAAVREGGGVRAVVSVVPQLPFPPADDLPPPDPNVPPPVLPPFALPGDGYVLRETAAGWEDEQRTSFAGSTSDRPLKSDPVLAFQLDTSGRGWAVGGWSGHGDSIGRGTSASGGAGSGVRARVRTASIARFGPGPEGAPVVASRAAVPQPAGPVRFAVAGNAACEQACATLGRQAIGPDRTLGAALSLVASMRGGAGPRALLYTGNRVATGLGVADGVRYAELLGSQPGLPVFPALGSGDVADGTGSAVFEGAFGGFPGPFGEGAPPAGVSIAGIPGGPSDGGARTHYAFDSAGSGGAVRVIVIDNSHGSLALSDPFQNPPEAQLPWLEAVLADARARGIATIVMGSRSLNANFTPRLNVASDASQVARVLVDGGASAYLFDRPEENRTMRIPAGGGTTIPSFGAGTLGYRSELSGVVGLDVADSLFGDSGVLLLEVNAALRDPATNRAPVGVRLIPVIQDLSLEATDGTLMRRSIPALFSGLGRRPLGGDRWGATAAGSGVPTPSGSTPYTAFPPEQCLVAGCADRIRPEFSFTSSDDDIADFVRQDPASSNLHKPFLDANDKVVTDHGSGLLCPFNAGTTTVTISAGGFSYSEKVTVQDGSVRRPCGTRPLRPDRFKRTATGAVPPAPPGPPPGGDPPLDFTPPPPPASPVPPTTPNPVNVIPPAPLQPNTFLPPTAPPVAAVPAAILPPPPAAVRPMPPGGAPARTYQVEEEEEEEAAVEESHAFSRYEAREEGGGSVVPPYLLGLVLIAALGAATVRGGPRTKRRASPAAARASARRH